MSNSPKKVVVIGGGTGTFVSLFGLKQYPVDLSAIITMTDSGGSSGKLRDQYGVLPPGDIRQALIALSDSDRIWRELFLYRFENGDFKGHNFGNVFLTVLEKLTNNFEKSIELAEEILKTKGQVIPVTLENGHINARLKDGTLIKTEALIDQKVRREAIVELTLDHEIKANPKAILAITSADLIIVGPGDLYTSVLPVFTLKEVVHAYQNSKAKKVLVLNLMNKLGQTDDFKASDFLKTYTKYLGTNPFDYLIANNSPLPPDIVQRYNEYGESEVINDLTGLANPIILSADIVSQFSYKTSAADVLERSLIRHDPEKLASFIWEEIIREFCVK
jgi:uncharacterized cofD-like protein